MIKVYDTLGMKELESVNINEYGIEDIVLMERAALTVSSFVSAKTNKKSKILCICGTGNNGADALCVARILKETGKDVTIFINSGHHESNLFCKQKNTCTKLNIPFVDSLSDDYDIIVDGLIGIGLKGKPDNNSKSVIDFINSSKSYVVSIDIPSGLNSDTGNALGCCVHANTTVVVGRYKCGDLINKAINYTGTIIYNEIGIFDSPQTACSYKIIQAHEFADILPKRNPAGNKSTFGKVLIIAGSERMGGCAFLAAKAALKTGCGMVKVITHEANKSMLENLLPEAMFDYYNSNISYECFKENSEWCDFIAIGPGIGKDTRAKQLVEMVLNTDKDILLDADAINTIASDSECLNLLRGCFNSSRNIILTPHKKELSRLINAINDSEIYDSASLCKKSSFIVVEKGAHTIIHSSESYINMSGNDALATAGSGDVLTGIAASLCAINEKSEKQHDLAQIIALAVYLHGQCADKWCFFKNEYAGSMTATDIIGQLSGCLCELQKYGE